MSANNNDNANDNDSVKNIIFTIKDTKLYVPVATLSAKDNQKLSNFLAKDLKYQFIRMRTKIPQMNIGTFSTHILLELIDF